MWLVPPETFRIRHFLLKNPPFTLRLLPLLSLDAGFLSHSKADSDYFKFFHYKKSIRESVKGKGFPIEDILDERSVSLLSDPWDFDKV